MKIKIIADIVLILASAILGCAICHTTSPAPAAAQEQATLYTKILELPRGKQVEMYATLTPAERSSLWRAHLGQSLASHNLNATQQALVLDAMALATPQLFDGSEEARKTVRDFTARVKAEFDKETAGAIFARMEPVGIRAIEKPECTCSLVSDWCFQSRCHAGACMSLPFGCGLMWVEECNGHCA